MDLLGVGIVLHPDPDFLEAARPLAEEHAEFLEVSPESPWQATADWAETFEQIQGWLGKPFVGHGLGLSLGTGDNHEADQRRLRRWLTQIEKDCQRFGYLWYTEHLGWVSVDGREVVLPLPLPATDEAARLVAGRLNQLKPIIPTVGFENQVSYFSFSKPTEEADFWNRICATGDLWLLLDLHNAYTQCVNYDVRMEDYLAGVDLTRVLEIHLSGGSESDPNWLPSGRQWRLDTHDGPVPEPVWEAYRSIRLQCPNLRGVVVERQNTSLTAETVSLVADEVERAKRIFWEG